MKAGNGIAVAGQGAGGGAGGERSPGPGPQGACSRRHLVALAGRLGLAGGVVAVACSPGGQQSPAALLGGRSVKLVYAYPLSVPEQDRLRALPVQRATTQYPSLEVDQLTGSGDTFKEKLLALAAGGSFPDVMHLNTGRGSDASDLAGRGLLLPVDDRLKRDRGFRWEDFWPGARQAGQYAGTQAALPFVGLNAALFYFNKNLFAAGGRPTPDQHFQRKQWTWDTLLSEAPQLTKRGPTGELLQAGLGYPWTQPTWALVLLRSYGADFLSDDGMKVVIDTPPAAQALRLAQELAARRRTMPLRGEGNSTDLVREGKVAQAVYWMHAAAWWRELSFDWDVAPTPAGPARRATYGAINLLGIGRQTKEPDAGWAFAGVALSPEADLEIASGFGSVVLRQSGIPAWRERMKSKRPNNLDLIEETAKGLSLEPLSKPHPQIGQVEAILKREMDNLLLDSKPPEEVTRTIATEGNALLGAK